MKKDINKEEEKLREMLNTNDRVFNVPSGYFEFLPGQINNQVNSLPDFNKTSQTNPFDLPAGYFAKLPSAVNERILTKKNKLQEWISNIGIRRAFPLALVTIFIVAGIFYFKQKNNNIKEPFEISSDDLKNSTYLDSMDEALFVDILSGQKDIVTDETLEQYLIDNNIELSQIENKL